MCLTIQVGTRMIINKPEIVEDERYVTVSSRVDIQGSTTQYPKQLWFSFPKEYAGYVTHRADGFAAALLPLAMTLGEDLEVCGPVDCRLAHGLQEYLRVQSLWKPDQFKPVRLSCLVLDERRDALTMGAAGCAFSGGVDSFHTLWSHLLVNEHNPRYQISHALMINGFDKDSDLDNTGSFNRLLEAYEPIMKKHGVALLVSRTNILQFIDPWVLKQSFGAIVTSSALVLGRLLARFYIPSSYRFTELGLYPEGSHLMLDGLLCTETMEVIHDGAHLTRVEKTAVLAQWPDTHSRLRVCFNQTNVADGSNVIENCCLCEKCIRTMVTLDMFGVLGRCAAFPKPLRRGEVRKCDYTYPGSRIFAREIIQYADKIGRRDIAFDFRYAVIRSIVGRGLRRIYGRIRRALLPVKCCSGRNGRSA
jgi:hypothetical protein